MPKLNKKDEQFPEEFGKKLIDNHGYTIGYEHTLRKTNNTSTKNTFTDKTSNSSFDSDEDGVEDFILEDLPITNETTLNAHEKCISALAIDKSGSRLVSGDYLSEVKLWDFSGMSYEKPNSFRGFEPFVGYQMKDLKYNLTSEMILCASSSRYAKIYDRDGFDLAEFVKGDPYIHDLKRTEGHVSNITCCEWHPNNKNLFMTAAQDSTVRQWDIYDNQKNYNVLVVKSGSKLHRTFVTNSTYSKDGKLIAIGTQDGKIGLWDQNAPFIRPKLSVLGHKSGSDISSIIFSANMNHIATRGCDDTVKLWDMRNFTTPLLFKENLPTFYSETNICFSPDEKLIVCGTCERTSSHSSGKLYLLERDSMQTVEEIDVSSSGVNKVLWHHGLNQIFCGTGDGKIKLYFNPKTSVKGAKMFVNKHAAKKLVPESEDFGFQPMVIAPYAFPDFHDEPLTMSVSERKKLRMDPVKSKRPDPPVVGPGRNGQIGTSFANNIIRHRFKDKDVNEDPREVLYKYDKIAKESPYFVAPAYKKYQPNPIFKDTQDEEDELREVVKRNQRPPKE